MTAAWGSFDTWWENFGYWLNSDQGRLVCGVLVLVLLLSILYFVTRVYERKSRKNPIVGVQRKNNCGLECCEDDACVCGDCIRCNFEF